MNKKIFNKVFLRSTFFSIGGTALIYLFSFFHSIYPTIIEGIKIKVFLFLISFVVGTIFSYIEDDSYNALQELTATHKI